MFGGIHHCRIGRWPRTSMSFVSRFGVKTNTPSSATSQSSSQSSSRHPALDRSLESSRSDRHDQSSESERKYRRLNSSSGFNQRRRSDSDSDRQTYDDIVLASTQNQFQAILKQSKYQESWRRLKSIISYTQLRGCGKWTDRFFDEIYSLNKKGANDGEIYSELAKMYHKEIKPSEENNKGSDSNWQKTRVQSRVRDLLDRIPKLDTIQVKSVLDLGCSEGSITAALGDGLGLSAENIHGCDVVDIPQEKREGIQFHHIKQGDAIPLGDSSQTIVTALMSLHHVEKVQEMIKEISRVLEDGGILLIREHDIDRNEALSVMLDLVHGLYCMVWNSPPEMETFTEYFACYRRKAEWVSMITSAGFEDITQKETTPRRSNDQEFFYMTFKKVQ
eukprot:TRINITY_DN1192_c0_g1_i1.p1 TRINITY_DN1192_c0_g1~~TRINITY_DN1192_c0_g1_i1.p1  ORF type:complete len:390 (-),score=94.22 TRINITY_DN1192_c0_g1_i1:12-1181(-)